MKKKTNYFSHDSNSRNDSKILAVRIKYGVEGYGIYFMLLERMREESDYMCIKDYNSIAFDLRVDTSKVKSVVEDFGLFVFTDDGKYFYSESFMERMEFKDEKSKKAAESAVKRWEKEKSMRTHTEPDANALQTNPKKDASKVKKSKVKKSKVLGAVAPTPEQQTFFENFEKFILKSAPNVGKMKEPFTIKQYLKLKEKFSSEQIKKLVLKMHNYKPLLSKNNSAYLTFLNWIERDYPKTDTTHDSGIARKLEEEKANAILNS
ncbi:MAG TPA: Lin1244/Lin1753 domain-containing protein [Hanamia sp.]|nr:Lin1244/Lin1753 domain-containing protein [Hanamia sp.]